MEIKQTDGKWERVKKQRIPQRKNGVMSKKELKAFFGHSFGQTTLGGNERKVNMFGNMYTLFADKNNALYDIEPLDEMSKDFLSHHRGVQISLI